ncbi:hypothetical protein DV737_g5101, partial [Chaetothyriales sp. CBS 132003]
MATHGQDGPTAARTCLSALQQDIQQAALSDDQRADLLTQLKVLGRELSNVKPLYDKNGFSVLAHYGFGEFPRRTVREALRCMANALLLIPQTQNYFADLGLLPKAVDDLRLEDNEDEFLLSRVLFLMTYNKTASFEEVADKFHLCDSIIKHIRRHASDAQALDSDPTAAAALSETLKLLFNAIHTLPKYAGQFTPAVPALLKTVTSSSTPSPPLQPPLTWKLNALASVDFPASAEGDDIEAALGPDLSAVLEKLVAILDESLKVYKASQLDTEAIPLITTLQKINAAAGRGETRQRMKASLLPKDSERDLPLGQSSSLASRLLRLTTHPGLANIPEAVSSLLFELSDKDAASYIQNVGYGYAAGYLMTHEIALPEGIQQPSGGNASVPVNPVTGQRLDREPELPLPNMSQEEKEREAERLFILFERLKATGVVDVQNPVQQAHERGRIEELEDSDDSN